MEKHKEFGMSKDQENAHSRRDGETLFVLGVFLVVLGLPVILGSWWAEKAIQMWVCLISGFILAGIGGAFVYYGKKALKRLG